MKTTVSAFTLFITLVFCGTSFAAPDKGPESINLKDRYAIEGKKRPVVFNHRKHQEKVKCLQCHQKEDGGPLSEEIITKDTISNDFHRKICWPCHKDMKVPVGNKCIACHK